MGIESGYFEKHSEACSKPSGGECTCSQTRFHAGEGETKMEEKLMNEEERQWLENALDRGGSFVKAFAQACFAADDPNYYLLFPTLRAMMNKYPSYNDWDTSQENKMRDLVYNLNTWQRTTVASLLLNQSADLFVGELRKYLKIRQEELGEK